tara:strand:- start:89 stop:931 length:843 start_codon:yes stop_codon:yes gene_type:complete
MDSENEKIRNELLKGKITFTEAYNRLKKLPKVWKTPEWQEQRSQKIKPNCEQCGINRAYAPMVIQHLVQPPKFRDIRRTIFENKFSSYLDQNNIDFDEIHISDEEYRIYLEENVEIREVCPSCSKQYFSTRKTMSPKYRCSSCWHEFDVPEEIKYLPKLRLRPDKDDVINRMLDNKLRNEYYELRKKLWEKLFEETGREALLISMQYHDIYISFKSVATFCKTCATKMDLVKQLLCYSCKKKYFNYQVHKVCHSCYYDNKIEENPYQSIVLKGEFENFCI